MTKRELALGKARIAGYHNDGKSFYTTCIENRVSRESMLEAWRDGARAKANGLPCTCRDCYAASAATT